MSDTTQIYFADTKSKAVFSEEGASPQFLMETPKFKVLVVGLHPGQLLPPHPGDSAMYHFLEGEGLMTVEEDIFDIRPGSTIVVPAGAKRGINAKTRIIFLASKSEG